MFNFKRTGITRVCAACCVAMLAAGLSACGRSNDSAQPSVASSTPPTPDAFTDFIEAQVLPLRENDEPIPIDAVTPTSPETTEPNPLG